MRSLEKSHRSTDMDQFDPEHINREVAEFSWDDLSKEPFRGNQQQSSGNTVHTAENLKNKIDNLLADDAAIQSRREEEAKRRVQDIFQKMDSVGSFGKSARGGKSSTQEFNEEISRAQEADKDNDRNQKLSDISTTF